MSFWDRVASACEGLDRASYYEVLGVSARAGPVEIASRYYALVARLHPDRHARERDPARRESLTRLFARIGDAYRVLTDPGLRRAYDEALARGEVRLAPESRVARASAPERDPSTELGRQLLEKGLGRLEVGDARGARSHLELAARYEPSSQAIAEALSRAREELSGIRSRPSIPKPPSQPPEAERPPPAPAPAPREVPPTVPARAHPRVPANVRIKLKLPTWDRYETFRTRDLSRGGMFVRAAQPLARGTVVRLQLASPDGQAVEIRAQVVRAVSEGEGAGMGLRFLEVSEETRRRVDGVVESAGLSEGGARWRAGAGAASAADVEGQSPSPEEAAAAGVSLRELEPAEPRLHVRERMSARPLLADDLFADALASAATPSANPLYVPGENEAREGRELLAAGEVGRAVEALEAAVTARPEDFRTRATLCVAKAYAAEKAGRPREARAHYEAALQADPTCAEAISALRG
jgi:uncharacterized protein (TIGR02266 family)